ncbi:hypothetical protein C0992_007647 [Termitomyces sp. T32_za158]|nr:hypothetical protein C0992_007647 [Termitomyces sp. T32_za158]
MAVLIGAPVGGVIGILLLACLLFLFRRKIFSGLATSGKKRSPPILIERDGRVYLRSPCSSGSKFGQSFSEPYLDIPDSHSTAPSSSGPHSVSTRSQGGSGIQLIVQGGSLGSPGKTVSSIPSVGVADMVQTPPPEKSLSKSSSGLQHPSSLIVGTSAARAGPSSVEVRTHGTEGMGTIQTQQIQGLVNQLQQAIASGGIVVTPENEGASPPPYEQPGKRATS